MTPRRAPVPLKVSPGVDITRTPGFEVQKFFVERFGQGPTVTATRSIHVPCERPTVVKRKTELDPETSGGREVHGWSYPLPSTSPDST